MLLPYLVILRQLKLLHYISFLLSGVRLSPLGTAANSGLLYKPQMIDEDDFWSNWWNEIWQGKPKYSEKTYPSATLSPQNPTWQTRSRTPDRSGGKPATNRLSYGAPFFSPISSPLTTRRFTVEVFDPASITLAHNRSSANPFFLDCRELAPVSFVLLLILVLLQHSASELDSLISTLHGPHGNQPVLLTKPVHCAVS
jgi:hypothetical protein